MNIAIIEDDKIFASKIAKKLERNKYTTSVFNSSKSFYESKRDIEPDLYLMDLQLNDDTGFNIINHIRNNNKEYTPIIILSGYNDTESKVYGLDLGADDYITKPVPPEELLARIRSVLRRHNKLESTTEIKVGELIFNLINKKVTIGDKEVRLPKKENQILEYFITNKGKIISKETLIKKVWGPNDFLYITENTINATMSKLRKRLGNNFNLKTKIGQGYILED
ncbi:MAG: response regulator transcription factor [Candidatus Gracilibacteria bacterium]|nr:response regulator transcription factor [Candidatus Gracilibacteria bacterium]